MEGKRQVTSGYERWVELADRDAVGDELTVEDRAFLDEYAATDPRARAELALFGSIAPMTSDESGDEALAEAAVRAVLSQRAPAQRRGRWLLWGVGSAAAAAAAAAAVLVVRGGHDRATAPLATSVVEYVAGAAA